MKAGLSKTFESHCVVSLLPGRASQAGVAGVALGESCDRVLLCRNFWVFKHPRNITLQGVPFCRLSQRIPNIAQIQNEKIRK